MRFLRLVALAAWRSALDQWAWRSFLVTLSLNQAVAPIIGFVVWRVVDREDPQVITYFFFLLIVQLATVSYEDHTLATSIYSGEITGDLLQPQPVITPFLGANLSMRFWHVVYGLPFIVALAVISRSSLVLSPLTILAAVPALILAGLLRFLFTTTVALSAFWSEQARNLVGLSNSVTMLAGGVAVPLFLLRGSYAGIGRVLPFWVMLGFPAEAASGVLSTNMVIWGYVAEGIWTALAVAAAMIAWQRGLRRYTGIGA